MVVEVAAVVCPAVAEIDEGVSDRDFEPELSVDGVFSFSWATEKVSP